MNKERKIIEIYLLISLFSLSVIFGQESTENILWDKIDNVPISYATIKGLENYVISNEDGVFEFQKTDSEILIQSVVYESLETDFEFLKANDTIFMKPLIYELDQVVISKDGLYTQMLKTVLTDYALEPHKEKFFLRAVIRKNNELYKIVDFSGLIEKQLLFDTTSKPMPEKNYKVQIENIRKVGIEDKDIDFRLFGFKELLTNIIRVAFDKDNFNIIYESTKDKGFKKITLEPEDKDKTKIQGFYSLNKDKTFKEVDVIYENKNAEFEKLRKSKYRTVFYHWNSNFERNSQTGKLQLNKATLNGKTEVYEERENYVFDFSYVY